MAFKKKKTIKNKKNSVKRATAPIKVSLGISLPEEIKQWIFGLVMFLMATIIVLSFFDLAGIVGVYFIQIFSFLIGKTVFVFPLLFVLGGMSFFIKADSRLSKGCGLVGLAIVVLIVGITGLLGVFSPEHLSQSNGYGGWLGYLISWPFVKIFGDLATKIIFLGVVAVGVAILWYLLCPFLRKVKFVSNKEYSDTSLKSVRVDKKSAFIKKIFTPKFEVKEIEPSLPPIVSEKQTAQRKQEESKGSPSDLGTKYIQDFSLSAAGYEYPPFDLLETDSGTPTVGDIKINSAIIRRTLENFDISVEMSEVNIGPTLTQYTLKPAEGIKLSKITGLSNDLSLALAAHPIRIEAPIPGRSLVGIEMPNKTKTMVRLRNLLQNSNFQNSNSLLSFALGRDVAGNSVFADLARMPHLLVAGSTGTGKTVGLNSIILSLLYRNSPETLRLILVDPKRVEFSIFNKIPHLLTDVIVDAQRTINVLKWLTTEMERRFEVLSKVGSKNIVSYNKFVRENVKKGKDELDLSPLPYIVLVIDELADLMASRGREVEGAIVRLAQMARAVGIHLIVATQRPSVEVITGLIKANITSRVAFQVASQTDSRTILDMAGAEKLLGAGDMLFISGEISKPKRIQGAYVSEKEVKNVSEYLTKNKKNNEQKEGDVIENDIAERSGGIPKNSLDALENGSFSEDEDPLYQEAKRIVIESKKASASLLQRRLRVGYARAARLVDHLEDNGVIGPGEGAKPREVYVDSMDENKNESRGIPTPDQSTEIQDRDGERKESGDEGIIETVDDNTGNNNEHNEHNEHNEDDDNHSDDGFVKL